MPYAASKHRARDARHPGHAVSALPCRPAQPPRATASATAASSATTTTATRPGSISDFTDSLDDYGTTQPSCYEFKGAGNGKGVCVKNNAASVWNRTSKTVRVYFNSNFAGAHQDFAAGARATSTPR